MSLIAFSKLVEKELNIDNTPIVPFFAEELPKLKHQFTPKVPTGHNETKQILASLKQDVVMKSEPPSVAVTNSLLGKQSGKDRIDRVDIYKKHDIGMLKHEEHQKAMQQNEPKTTIGGLFASKTEDLGKTLIKRVHYEKVEQSYHPIKLPYS